eukprot:TRINITY_DN39358_c0_g1_i1.p1 TRINITY_DN39358_c0_g1~~TRINITY_DN39358_c0_g1_i1.p1  ORF type:complete len:108 (+),score=8.18 TRINITY_DN39358_c0_g1_i1:2-325(+)
MSGKKEKERAKEYEEKLHINGTLDEVLKVSAPKKKKKEDKQRYRVAAGFLSNRNRQINELYRRQSTLSLKCVGCDFYLWMGVWRCLVIVERAAHVLFLQFYNNQNSP